MSDKKSPSICFEELKERIEAVPADACANMTMPYEEAMQEGRRVAAIVAKYREQLGASDINPVLLDEIDLRVGAFSFCVASFESYVEISESHAAQFADLKKEAYALRRKLLAAFDYVFRDTPEVKIALANIREGRGNLDMFKDLLSIHKLSVDYGDRLDKAHFNFADSKRAFELYTQLFGLAAERDIDPEKVSATKLLCHKAWTLLWEAMEEIYAAGRFVFYADEKIEELFYADYWQKLSTKQSKSSSTTQEFASEEAPIVTM